MNIEICQKIKVIIYMKVTNIIVFVFLNCKQFEVFMEIMSFINFITINIFTKNALIVSLVINSIFLLEGIILLTFLGKMFF